MSDINEEYIKIRKLIDEHNQLQNQHCATAALKIAAEIHEFKTDRYKCGRLKHHRFDEMIPIMIGLLQGGYAHGIEQTYKVAKKLYKKGLRL